jgi:hypothetical protein
MHSDRALVLHTLVFEDCLQKHKSFNSLTDRESVVIRELRDAFDNLNFNFCNITHEGFTGELSVRSVPIIVDTLERYEHIDSFTVLNYVLDALTAYISGSDIFQDETVMLPEVSHFMNLLNSIYESRQLNNNFIDDTWVG